MMFGLPDDVVYVLILLTTILIGFPLRRLQSPLARQIATGGIGLITVISICRLEAIHSLFCFFVNLIIIKLHFRYTSILSFTWCFSYLLFFRVASSIFDDIPKPSALGNAVQLILTLKLVSVAIEIAELRHANRAEKTVSRYQLNITEEPSAFQILCYSYCYVGLLTGPFFRYRTYHDFLNSTVSVDKLPFKDEILPRLKQIAVFGALHFLSKYFFNFIYITSDDFYQRSFAFRAFYVAPLFFTDRMRFYCAWLLAECAFLTAAIGAYPAPSRPRPGHGPTADPSCDTAEEKKSYSFETIRNIDPYACDFTPTVRLGMRGWNMSVQWWLANYVHKRWPHALKQFRVVGVMAVSAFWHGMEAGFWCAFLTMPLYMLAEDLLITVVKQRLPQSWHLPYDWFSWFMKMRAFEYMFIAFRLLSWNEIWRYWASTYFWLHISSCAVIMICVPLTIFSRDKSTQEKEKKIN